MKILLTLLVAILATTAMTQDTKNLYRIKIQHADPYLVYLLLSGKANFGTPPELSTTIFSGNGGFGSSGFGGGTGGPKVGG